MLRCTCRIWEAAGISSRNTASPIRGCHNGRKDFRACFLRFEDGFRLELMTRPGLSAGGQNRRGDTHLAFSVGSGEGIDHLTERLRRNGFQVLSGPRTTGDGYYESCVAGFEGNLIEITI